MLLSIASVIGAMLCAYFLYDLHNMAFFYVMLIMLILATAYGFAYDRELLIEHQREQDELEMEAYDKAMTRIYEENEAYRYHSDPDHHEPETDLPW